MPALVLIGAQWGDEGKGKATDQLGGRVDLVVKFNGGNNAGHTVVIGDETYALRLLLSADAHLIASYNRTLDRVAERFLGKQRIGTTGRGIGPTYADKMSRVGIRVEDLFDTGILRQKLDAALELKNQILVKIYNRRAITVEE